MTAVTAITLHYYALLKCPCIGSATCGSSQQLIISTENFPTTLVTAESLTRAIWSAATLKYICLSGMMPFANGLQSCKPMALLLKFL
jgi:hypothetical protein